MNPSAYTILLKAKVYLASFMTILESSCNDLKDSGMTNIVHDHTYLNQIEMQ